MGEVAQRARRLEGLDGKTEIGRPPSDRGGSMALRRQGMILAVSAVPNDRPPSSTGRALKVLPG
jgi:hypothetical protein